MYEQQRQLFFPPPSLPSFGLFLSRPLRERLKAEPLHGRARGGLRSVTRNRCGKVIVIGIGEEERFPLREGHSNIAPVGEALLLQ